MKISGNNLLLHELRSMAAAAANKPAEAPKNASPVGQFGQVMTKALDSVNSLQMQSADLQHRVEIGDKSVSLVQAMIASQKAGVAFQATVQVRNRLVSAYQEIMNMPI